MGKNNPSVVHATAWYRPYSVGGTEVYVEGLIDELASLGVTSSVLVPRIGGAAETYRHRGFQVETYAVNEEPAPNELRGFIPHRQFESFGEKLKGYRGAIYHQHSWTRGCGHHHLRAARELGFKTVLTVHVPGNTCLRGTMLRFGKLPCDGLVEDTGCGACWAQGRGMPTLLSQSIANMPLGLAKQARRGGGRLATALSARALAAESRERLAEMIANSDRIVAVCRWLHAALELNGVPSEKLVISRQGVSRDYIEAARSAASNRRPKDHLLRLLFLGRWDPVKGVDVVVKAMNLVPRDLPIHLTIRAVPAPEDSGSYEHRVREMAQGDDRITIMAPVGRTELATTLSSFDALVVPSLWMETGPLVVLEAQAAGLFILGSRLGGIAELVDEGDGGQLVEAGNVSAWSKAFLELATRHRQAALPRPSRPVRDMSKVAAEMTDIYRSLSAS